MDLFLGLIMFLKFMYCYYPRTCCFDYILLYFQIRECDASSFVLLAQISAPTPLFNLKVLWLCSSSTWLSWLLFSFFKFLWRHVTGILMQITMNLLIDLADVVKCASHPEQLTNSVYSVSVYRTVGEAGQKFRSFESQRSFLPIPSGSIWAKVLRAKPSF